MNTITIATTILIIITASVFASVTISISIGIGDWRATIRKQVQNVQSIHAVHSE